MKVFGLAGWSGAGKTTLLTRLIPLLTAEGLTVSTIKHAHHGFDLDQTGKDSWRHRQAGAAEVLVASAQRWALLHEHRGYDGRSEDPAGLDALLDHMSPVDLVLVEGFKAAPIAKLEVWRRTLGKPLLCDGDPHIVALAGDAPPASAGPLKHLTLPRFDLDATAAIAAFILDHCGLSRKSRDDGKAAE